MPQVNFPFSDSPGIAKDIEPWRLPNGVWSDGNNMLFKDRIAEKAFGWDTFISSPSITPYAIFFCPLNNSGFWIYAGLTDVRAFDVDGTTAEITRTSGAGGDYTGAEYNRWNFAFLHGLGILNNGADDPQLWSPPSLSTTLVDLTNWPASTTCKVMRSYLNFLVALDVTESGTRYAQAIRWSSPADPGSVPAFWDYSDATVDAGRTLLSGTPGVLVDCLPLGGSNIVYKEDSVWAMTFVGGAFIFNFQQLPLSFGLLAQDCIATVGRHQLVATQDDLVLHNGSNPVSIIDEKNRSWLFNNLEPGGKQNCFMINYTKRHEVWFCFPETGETTPTRALIWNSQRNSIAFRDLPQARHAVYTPAMRLSTGDTWESESSLTWAGETSLIWDDLSKTGVTERVFFINERDTSIDQMQESQYTDDGTDERSYLERQSMAFIGMDYRENAIVDLRAVKFVKEIWPQITGTVGATVSVYVGTQMEFEEAITWLDPVTFTIGTTNLIPVYKPCRFLSVRFDVTDGDLWELHGFTYELDVDGVF